MSHSLGDDTKGLLFADCCSKGSEGCQQSELTNVRYLDGGHVSAVDPCRSQQGDGDTAMGLRQERKLTLAANESQF